MARVNLNLAATKKPAFDGLTDVAVLIAERDGEAAAMDWLTRQLRDDLELFMDLRWDSRPELRVIQGGA